MTTTTAPAESFEAMQARMRRQFDRVCDPTNWKNPIDTTVAIATHDKMRAIAEAVVYFTGSVPTFSAIKIRGVRCVYRVRAAGYYRTIGA
jgi:hypothetical protein